MLNEALLWAKEFQLMKVISYLVDILKTMRVLCVDLTLSAADGLLIWVLQESRSHIFRVGSSVGRAFGHRCLQGTWEYKSPVGSGQRSNLFCIIIPTMVNEMPLESPQFRQDGDSPCGNWPPP